MNSLWRLASLVVVLLLVSAAGSSAAESRHGCSPVQVAKGVFVFEATRRQFSNPQDYLNCVARALDAQSDVRSLSLMLPKGSFGVREALYLPSTLLERGVSVRIEGSPNGGTQLSAAQALPSWSVVTPKVKSASLRLYKASLPEEVRSALNLAFEHDHGKKSAVAMPELIVNGHIFQLAQWPHDGFARIGAVESEGLTADLQELPDVLKLDGLIVHGFFYHDWADSIRKLDSLNKGSGKFSLLGASPRYGFRQGGRFVFQNSVAFIQKAGRYAYDLSAGEVYFSMPPDVAPNKVEFTSGGGIWSGSASNLTLSNLVFEGGAGTAISIVGNKVVIDKVEIRNFGLGGVRLNGVENSIKNSFVHAVGGIGVDVVGGDRKTLISANNLVESNRIENFGRVIWSSNPGVRVVGVGAVVRNNKVSLGPHAGIFYFGNDHLIDGNEVSNIAMLTDDVGAIYTGQDWSGRGSTVVGNYVHDIHGAGKEGATAFYLDDQVSGVLLKRNLAWNVDRGFLLGGGRDNHIEGNVVVNAKECIKIDERGVKSQAVGSRVWNDLVTRLEAVPYAQEPYSSKYPGLSDTLTYHPGLPVRNRVVRNGGNCKQIVVDSAAKYGVVRDFIPIDSVASTSNSEFSPDMEIIQSLWRKWDAVLLQKATKNP